ncbi:MAG: SnoaL-like domain-containing protein [Pyrinomonadaceae bacterium]|nr:SnoaL-like domain-containing protein [Pyrinomonadaceae bacterium]
MKLLLLALFVLFVTTLSNAQSDSKRSKIENAIRDVINRQVDDWNKGDIEGFMEGYWKSPDLRFVSGNTVSKGWQAAYDRYKKGYDTREKMGTLSFSELEITVLNKKSAFVTGRFTLVRKKDTPTGLFTLVFRKLDGGWKVVHDHTST